uniref:protein-serine/threonine phosphatase n=1 Tax=Pipistrellus kuhlii TaxID=59472 RepID=A0A7J7VVS6_PIPKU|nr:protein phosphatase, Mg2+/Mn2+ dependent 1G [Pipistrellus kuhlii]
MGAYLSQPNTVKCSGDGAGAPRLPLPYGFSAMQGWRVSMEDAHNCIPELDSETAMFSVYDGHGGEEVALYCAKYLPDIIKDQKAYKEGKLQKALEDAFLAIDAKLTTEEVIKELAQIAGRPTEDEDEKEKVADEDDASDKLPRVAKSKFFEDSEDESDEAEEEEEDSEECSEEEDGYSSEEAENEEDEDDTEEAEEDEEEEEEMMVPGMEGKEEPGSDSGTTAVVALIRGKQLIVANAGDSRCVVSEAGKALDMSYDHKPEDEVELARIKNAGGKVTMDGRVNGGLNLSRAIGDHFYKRNKNLPPEEQMISALPDIKMLTLTDDHEFMVIACDGIWNVMSSQEVIDFIQSKISQRDENGELRLLSSIVEELLDQCLAPDTSGDGTGCDNMTCIIICFKPRSTAEVQPESGKRKLEEALSTEEAEENGNSDNKKKAKRD